MRRSSVFLGLFACGTLSLPSACRSPGASSGSPSASASAQVAPLDTSWERTASRLLEPGDRAPDFEGLAHTGMRVRLSAFLDAPVVVYFYPRDASKEDAALARVFRDQWLRIHDRASMVMGVSADDRLSHRDFATAERLPFLLIADQSLAIARAFGVPVTEGRTGRVTFVIGKDGKVARVFTDVTAEGHIDAVYAALDDLTK